MTNLDHRINTRQEARISLNSPPTGAETTAPTPGAVGMPTAFDALLDQQRSLASARPAMPRTATPVVTRESARPEQPSRSQRPGPHAEPGAARDARPRSERPDPHRTTNRTDNRVENRNRVDNGGRSATDDVTAPDDVETRAADEPVDDVDTTEDEAIVDASIAAVAALTVMTDSVPVVDPSGNDAGTAIVETSDGGAAIAPDEIATALLDGPTLVDTTAAPVDDGDLSIDPDGDADALSSVDGALETQHEPTEIVATTEATISRALAEDVEAPATDEADDSSDTSLDDESAVSAPAADAAAGSSAASGNELSGDSTDGQGFADQLPEVLVVDPAAAAESVAVPTTASSPDGIRVDGANGVQPQRAAESAAAAVPVTAPQVAEFDGEVWEQVQKAVQLVRANGSGRHEVSLILRPDELGAVAVELIQHGDEVAVRIVTQTSAAQDRLDRARLLTELQSAGIDPSSVDISHHDPGRSGQGSDEADQGRSSGTDGGSGSNDSARRPIRRSGALASSSGGGLDLAL